MDGGGGGGIMVSMCVLSSALDIANDKVCVTHKARAATLLTASVVGYYTLDTHTHGLATDTHIHM